MIRIAFAALALCAPESAQAADAAGLDRMLHRLANEGSFSGAVVVRRAGRVEFARGYGAADPFTGRAFTPTTPVDSASIAKPVTASAVLLLARDGKIQLDQPVRRYLPEYPHASATVQHLLAHSAGLPFDDRPEALAGKTNAALLEQVGAGAIPPLFAPGARFSYCNLCYTTLAMLIERVSGMHYLDFVRRRVGLPASVTLRPQRLADWTGRAIGYRRTAQGQLERFDSWEGEALYGAANFSISAHDLASWGSEWWKSRLRPIRVPATASALIAGNPSGLTLGSWYCAARRSRCHYLGHHEGFHHMLYWDSAKRISVGMVTNNALSPALQQRLQRAIVAFAESRTAQAEREIASPLPAKDARPGDYALMPAETVNVSPDGRLLKLRRRGIDYHAVPIGSRIRYVPGLDVYLASDRHGRLRWLSLYEDFTAAPIPVRR